MFLEGNRLQCQKGRPQMLEDIAACVDSRESFYFRVRYGYLRDYETKDSIRKEIFCGVENLSPLS